MLQILRDRLLSIFIIGVAGILLSCQTTTEQKKPQFLQGTEWFMCGPACEKIFPVKILARAEKVITFQMPFGTLDVPEEFIEIIDMDT